MIIRHRDSENKVLFDFTKINALPGEAQRLVFLSEQDFYILDNCIENIAKFRKRVYTSKQDDIYTIVSDEQFNQFKQLVENLEDNMGGWVVANEFLERIAIALEEMRDGQEHNVLNLQDVFEALGLDPSEEQEDILEALQYLLGLAPGLPDFNIPKVDLLKMIGTWRFNGAIINLLQDIAISQRGQTVAQGGVDIAGIYDDLGDTVDKLLLPAGYAGKAIWLWNRIKPVDIPNWLGWLGQILGFTLGSIRDAGYTIAERLENITLPGLEEAIREQTVTTIVNCNNCTSSEIAGHLQPVWMPGYHVEDNDATWTDEEEPPVGANTTWNNPPGGTDYKCQAAKYIVDWLQAFYGHSSWELSENDNLITLADKFAVVLAAIPAIGATLSGLSSIIGLTLAYLAGGSTEIFETVNEHITDRKDDLYCALYTAGTAEEARQAFKDIMIEEGINALALSGLDVFLTMNNIMAILFFEPEQLATEIAFKDDECDCEDAEDFWYLDAPGGQPLPTLISGDLQSTAIVRSAYGLMFGGNRNYILLTATGVELESGFTIISIANSGAEPVVLDVYNTSFAQIYSTGSTTFAALVSENHRGRQIHLYSLAAETDNPFDIEFTLVD